MVFRLLVLDAMFSPQAQVDFMVAGVEVDLTMLRFDEINRRGRYQCRERGLELARHAEEYDAILIGDNMGTGVGYAAMIPKTMRRQTLIVWEGDYTAAERSNYAHMGYKHFGKRLEAEAGWLLQEATGDPKIDLDDEVEVVGVSTWGEFVCIRQGRHYFSVEVGDPDEEPKYKVISAEDAEEIRALTTLSTNPGISPSLDAVRRNIAPSRDRLIEFYYEMDPEARAIRDYLKFHDEDIKRRVATMQATEASAQADG